MMDCASFFAKPEKATPEKLQYVPRRGLALGMPFSLIKQPLELTFTETMHQLPCFSDDIRLRIGMMDPLYMYLPAADEHLRSRERKVKD